MSRILSEEFRSKITSADHAAEFISHGMNVGFSGFTGAGYPKALPGALAARIKAAHERGEEFMIGCYTGASTAPELDGVLAEVDGISFRMPYQSDPIMRNKINDGISGYSDIHLSHSGPQTWAGFLGKLDVAVIEVTAITEDGELVPSSSVGNNTTWLRAADKVILEVNSWQSIDLHGMHDIYEGVALPPDRSPVPLTKPGDRIGSTTMKVDPAKVDRGHRDRRRRPQHPVQAARRRVPPDRRPPARLPRQRGEAGPPARRTCCRCSPGVGNIANAVLAGLLEGPFENLTSYTEVIQDGMVDLLDSGKMTVASATAFSLSPEYAHKMNDNAADYRDKIILRPQDISNHPEMIRRLGVISCNGTDRGRHLRQRELHPHHGFADAERHRRIGRLHPQRLHLLASSPRPRPRAATSPRIVPMVSHHDHTEHDVHGDHHRAGPGRPARPRPRQRAKVSSTTARTRTTATPLHEYYDRA